MGKGIYKIEYNSLNLPQTVYIKNATTEAIIEYTYSAAGVKLRVKKSWDPGTISSGAEVNKALLTKTKQTDYLGNKIYEDGELKTILVDGGYYDCEKEEYFFYLTDHLGNNRVVADEDGNIVETNHYYPFGQTFAESSSQDVQPYKYNGKELDKDFGLNLYDYSARQMELAIGRFTSVDPLAEKYYNISPYAYVANNPLRFIDPDGCDTIHVTTDGVIQAILEGGDDVIVVDNPLEEVEIVGESPEPESVMKESATAAFFVSQTDSPALGPADIVAGAILAGATAYYLLEQMTLPVTQAYQQQSSYENSNGKNEKHGDQGRAETKAEKQIDKLEQELKNAKGNKRKDIKQKINNIRKDAAKKKKRRRA